MTTVFTKQELREANSVTKVCIAANTTEYETCLPYKVHAPACDR